MLLVQTLYLSSLRMNILVVVFHSLWISSEDRHLDQCEELQGFKKQHSLSPWIVKVWYCTCMPGLKSREEQVSFHDWELQLSSQMSWRLSFLFCGFPFVLLIKLQFHNWWTFLMGELQESGNFQFLLGQKWISSASRLCNVWESNRFGRDEPNPLSWTRLRFCSVWALST